MEDTTIKSFKDFLYNPESETLMNTIKKKVDEGDWYRAAGDCLCPCGKEYSRHKNIPGFEWLTILCNGHLVKL